MAVRECPCIPRFWKKMLFLDSLLIGSKTPVLQRSERNGFAILSNFSHPSIPLFFNPFGHSPQKRGSEHVAHSGLFYWREF